MTHQHQVDNSELARYFTQRQDCTILRQDAHKVLLRAHNPKTRDQDYFIKIYQYPHLFHSRIKDWKFMGGGHEYRTCNKLKNMGIPTPVPIGFATDRNWMGLPKQSLYASLWLDDVQTLDALIRLQHKHRHLDQPSWRHFVLDLGQFLGNIHRQLVNAKDLNTKNILVQRWSKTRPCFILVDYERIVFLKKFDLKKLMNALSQIGASLLPDFEGDIGLLCEGYSRQVEQIDAKAMCPKLIAASWEKNRQWREEIDGLFITIGQRLTRRNQTGKP